MGCHGLSEGDACETCGGVGESKGPCSRELVEVGEDRSEPVRGVLEGQAIDLVSQSLTLVGDQPSCAAIHAVTP